MINHLEEAYHSNNVHDLRDYLDVTPTRDIRHDLADMLRKYADIGFLVHIRDKLDDFITNKDKFEEIFSKEEEKTCDCEEGWKLRRSSEPNHKSIKDRLWDELSNFVMYWTQYEPERQRMMQAVDDFMKDMYEGKKAYEE
jgi:hypothetical protein